MCKGFVYKGKLHSHSTFDADANDELVQKKKQAVADEEFIQAHKLSEASKKNNKELLEMQQAREEDGGACTHCRSAR